MKFVQLWIATTPAVAETNQEVSANDAKEWLSLFDKIVDAVVANRADWQAISTPSWARGGGRFVS